MHALDLRKLEHSSDWDEGMVWATPRFDRQAVNTAGRALATRTFPMEADHVLAVVNNWRSIHAFQLNTFQNGLRRLACSIESDPIIAQRIKRLESIHAKLMRDQTDSMRLTQMQDIAGCRAVMSSIGHVYALSRKYGVARLRHGRRPSKDYIRVPKSDGYRGIHLIYEYKGRGTSAVYSGLKIELQLRTRLQHARATAVEAVGIFTAQALKSNQGDEDWLRFFALMSTAIAAIEGCPPVPGTPVLRDDLIEEIDYLVKKLDVIDRLLFYQHALKYETDLPARHSAKYYVLKLDFDTRNIGFTPFRFKESQRANITYMAEERSVSESQNVQIVLVSVDSFNALRRAYPNYFLDTAQFSELIGQVLKGEFPEPLPPPLEAGDPLPWRGG